MCCFFSAEANSNCIKRSLANLSNIKNSKWFKSCLAWISIILYILDISSDIYVGVDLIYHCHYYYGAIILSVILIPGFIFGFYLWFRAVKKGWSFKVLLFTPFFPIFGTVLIIPFTLYCLVNAALKIGSAKEEETETSASE